MSSGPPNKRIKKILTDTKQLKVSNFFASKSLDAATAANSTTTDQSSSLKLLNGVFDEYDITNARKHVAHRRPTFVILSCCFYSTYQECVF
jgi:hypothetical protein